MIRGGRSLVGVRGAASCISARSTLASAFGGGVGALDDDDRVDKDRRLECVPRASRLRDERVSEVGAGAPSSAAAVGRIGADADGGASAAGPCIFFAAWPLSSTGSVLTGGADAVSSASAFTAAAMMLSGAADADSGFKSDAAPCEFDSDTIATPAGADVAGADAAGAGAGAGAAAGAADGARSGI